MKKVRRKELFCKHSLWFVVLFIATAPTPAMRAIDSPALLVFGGSDHKTFLGCLNCPATSQSSVHNRYTYGSKYGETIFNRYSDYGSRYSDTSACNRYADDPPVIVDRDGNYYGRLTLNRYHPEIGLGKKLMDWLNDEVCK